VLNIRPCYITDLEICFWQLEMHKRLKENGTIPSFELEGLQCLGSMLHIVGLSGTHMDLSNISIQWFRIHPKESNKEIISGGIMLSSSRSLTLVLSLH
jgi:hypothetical protein